MIMPATTRENNPWKSEATVKEGSFASRADGASPSDEHDELQQLGERIADLAATINAAEGRMMALLADFDRRGGMEKRLRVLCRVARLEDRHQDRAGARAGSSRAGAGELTAEQVRHRNRALSVFVDGDGMYVVNGRLEPEVGAVLRRALEAAADALYRREKRVGEEVRQDGRAESRMGTEASAREGAKARGAAPTPRQRRAQDTHGSAPYPEATGMIGSGPRTNLPAVASGPFSNGAARYRDSDVPWAIEAAACEAVEETL